jgi:hypothetical protein
MDFYQVMSLVISFLSTEDLAALNLAQEAGDFKTVFDIFDKALKQAQKTGYTDGIITADDNRDNITIGFAGSLSNLTRFPDAEIAESAKKLLAVFEKYGTGIVRLPQREETAILTNVVSELRSTENAIALQKSGLSMWVDKLAEANLAFDELYTHRTEKESEFITGLTRTERANTQAAFEKLVRAIEAKAYLKGEAAYKPLADKINTELGNVKQAAKARTTLNANNAKPTTVS